MKFFWEQFERALICRVKPKFDPNQITLHISAGLNLTTIKQDGEVRTTMQRNSRVHSCKFEIHLWEEDVQDIKELGWLCNYIPSYTLPEQVEDLVRTAVTLATKTPLKKIPKFKCRKTSVSISLSNSDKASWAGKTYAFSVQCRQQHVAKLIQLLQATYHQQGQFLLYGLRYKSGENYAKAIRHQNNYIASHRVISIQGISPDHLWYFENFLKSRHPNILQVLVTRKSKSEGRYNLLTEAANLKSLALELHKSIGKTYSDFLENPSSTTAFTRDELYQWPPTMESRKLLNSGDYYSDSESFGPTDSRISNEGSIAYWSVASPLDWTPATQNPRQPDTPAVVPLEVSVSRQGYSQNHQNGNSESSTYYSQAIHHNI